MLKNLTNEEMFYKRTLKILWTEYVSNKDTLRKMETKRALKILQKDGLKF